MAVNLVAIRTNKGQVVFGEGSASAQKASSNLVPNGLKPDDADMYQNTSSASLGIRFWQFGFGPNQRT